MLCALGAVVVLAACAPDHARSSPGPWPAECYSCHEWDYLHTTSPVHLGSMPTDCDACHSMDAWIPVHDFDHRIFPLTGAHAGTPCAGCHGDPPQYQGVPTECVGCHRADYDASTFPGHEGFALTCQDCHSTSAWVPADGFDHSVFPLTGAHAQAACAACHGDPPRYQGISTECVGCHRADYDRSPYPGHDAFPLTCQDCHSTSAWTPASGGAHPERAFPIRSGPHAGIACVDCHDESLSSSYAQNVNCLQCHHRSRMDAVHVGEVGGYRWDDGNPDFCRQCHPTGVGGGDD